MPAPECDLPESVHLGPIPVVDCDTSGNSTLELSSLTVTLGPTSTATFADIDTVRVYIDTDNTFAGSTQIGSVAFDAASKTVTLDSGIRSVTNPTSKWIFVVVDISAAATASETFVTRVTDVGVSAFDNGSRP